MGFPKWSFGDLAGVIDLAGGKAVHAIAGHRASYQPVKLSGGDPVALIQQYRRVGIRSFYIADLDAISGQFLQATLLDEIVAAVDGDVWVDLGWSGAESEAVVDAIAALVDSHPCLRVIAATETADSPQALTRLAERLPVERICLGLDFRGGQFLVSKKLMANQPHARAWAAKGWEHEGAARAVGGNELDVVFAATPSQWIDHASTLGIHRLVILDIASVGKQVGAVTGDVCRSIKQANPNFCIWSGGGIRNPSDANQLIQQGCDRCLIATALHGLL